VLDFLIVQSQNNKIHPTWVIWTKLPVESYPLGLIYPDQWFFTEANFALQGTKAMSGDVLGYHDSEGVPQAPGR
jgi:hypothetical protein